LLKDEIKNISLNSDSIDILEIRKQYFIWDIITEKVNKILKDLWFMVPLRSDFNKDELNEYLSNQKIKEVDLDNAYEKIKVIWDLICLEQTIESTHTDIDGKYRLQLPVGSYYLYAQFESEYSKVDWFIPLQILSNEEIKIDFHNENAFQINNK